jgi:hypothetical protein
MILLNVASGRAMKLPSIFARELQEMTVIFWLKKGESVRSKLRQHWKDLCVAGTEVSMCMLPVNFWLHQKQQYPSRADPYVFCMLRSVCDGSASRHAHAVISGTIPSRKRAREVSQTTCVSSCSRSKS